MKKIIWIVYLLTLLNAPASAITWGSEDSSNDYPNVGAFIWRTTDTGDVFHICSGTLVHPQVFLTAGHCVVPTLFFQSLGLIDVFVSFDLDVSQAAIPTLYPVSTVHVHPLYTGKASQSAKNSNDIGLLILEDPINTIVPATLPVSGFLDALGSQLKHGQDRAHYTVVGYGANLAWPPPAFLDNSRRQIAVSEHLSLKSAWLLMSQNFAATAAGGTCFGDSGGPAFYTKDDGTEVIVGVTSWGDQNCVATGIDARVDIDATLEFISDIVGSLP